MAGNKRIGESPILNRSCFEVVVDESTLRVGALQKPISTAC